MKNLVTKTRKTVESELFYAQSRHYKNNAFWRDDYLKNDLSGYDFSTAQKYANDYYNSITSTLDYFIVENEVQLAIESNIHARVINPIFDKYYDEAHPIFYPAIVKKLINVGKIHKQQVETFSQDDINHDNVLMSLNIEPAQIIYNEDAITAACALVTYICDYHDLLNTITKELVRFNYNRLACYICNGNLGVLDFLANWYHFGFCGINEFGEKNNDDMDIVFTTTGRFCEIG